MSIIEKLVLLGKMTKSINEVHSVEHCGVYLRTDKFTEIFGTDNSKFEIEHWGGDDGQQYCSKAVRVDGVRIYAIFRRDNPEYCPAPPALNFEAAAAALTNTEVG